MLPRTSVWIASIWLTMSVVQAKETPVITIAIHGGAGVIAREQLGPDGGQAYRDGLAAALDAGYAVLENGGSSLDAVSAAVRLLKTIRCSMPGAARYSTTKARRSSTPRSWTVATCAPARSPA